MVLLGGWNYWHRMRLGVTLKFPSNLVPGKKKALLSVKMSGFRGIKMNAYSKILTSTYSIELFGNSLFSELLFLRQISNTNFPHIVCLQDSILMSVLRIPILCKNILKFIMRIIVSISSFKSGNVALNTEK